MISGRESFTAKLREATRMRLIGKNLVHSRILRANFILLLAKSAASRYVFTSVTQVDWSRGPMDRTMASEAVGGGSIPPGTTPSRYAGKF